MGFATTAPAVSVTIAMRCQMEMGADSTEAEMGWIARTISRSSAVRRANVRSDSA